MTRFFFFYCLIAISTLQAYAGKSKYSHIANAEIDGVHYYLNEDDQTAFVSYTQYYDYNNSNNDTYSGDIVVPERVTKDGITYTVIAVGNLAFSGNGGLHSVTLPPTITHIGQEAFNRCNNLVSVNIPDAVTEIERMAFRSCSSIETLAFPASAQMTSTDQMFYGCKNLRSLTLPTTLKYLSEKMFYNCQSLKSIDLPTTITGIGSKAFENCGIENLIIPPLVKTLPRECFVGFSSLRSIDLANVEEIKDYAFSGCSNLLKLYIPKTVTSISDLYTFQGCSSLESVAVDPENSIYSSPNNCNAILKGTRLVLGCKNTKIPNNVTLIDNRAFQDCAQLESLTLPAGVTSIGRETFMGCTALKSCNFPSALTKIEWKAFWNCRNLETVIIPKATNSIDESAFSYCTGITKIQVVNGNTTYDSRNNCNAIMRIADNKMILSCKNTTIPETATSMSYAAYYNLATKSYLYIPKAMVDIPLTRFDTPSQIRSIVVADENPKYDSRDNCNAIIETATNNLILGCINTKIPSSVTTIESNSFAFCTGLEMIEIPSSVTTIGGYAFYSCSGLKKIEIPASITRIEGYTFYGCTSLKDIVLPSTLQSMDYAFIGCEGLTSLTLPGSLHSLLGTFYNCPNIKTLYSLIEDPFWVTVGEMVDTDVYTTATLYVPKGTIETYRQSSDWNRFTNIQEWDPTIIETVKTEPNHCIRNDVLYDSSGRKLLYLTRGLNIIYKPNGKTIKVITNK